MKLKTRNKKKNNQTELRFYWSNSNGKRPTQIWMPNDYLGLLKKTYCKHRKCSIYVAIAELSYERAQAVLNSENRL